MHIQDYEYLYKSGQDLWDLWESSSFCEDCVLKRDGEEETMPGEVGLLPEPAPIPDDEAGAAPQIKTGKSISSTATATEMAEADWLERVLNAEHAALLEPIYGAKIRGIDDPHLGGVNRGRPDDRPASSCSSGYPAPPKFEDIPLRSLDGQHPEDRKKNVEAKIKEA